MISLQVVIEGQQRDCFAGEFAVVVELIMGTVWFLVNWCFHGTNGFHWRALA